MRRADKAVRQAGAEEAEAEDRTTLIESHQPDEEAAAADGNGAGDEGAAEAAGAEVQGADDNEADSGAEGEAEGAAEADEPEDDYNAAWEVLDVARTIYEKQLEGAAADSMREERISLAECFLALGDVSCETGL